MRTKMAFAALFILALAIIVAFEARREATLTFNDASQVWNFTVKPQIASEWLKRFPSLKKVEVTLIDGTSIPGNPPRKLALGVAYPDYHNRQAMALADCAIEGNKASCYMAIVEWRDIEAAEVVAAVAWAYALQHMMTIHNPHKEFSWDSFKPLLSEGEGKWRSAYLQLERQ